MALRTPLIHKLSADLWEVRSHLESGIARVSFTIDGSLRVLLHGFVKKAQQTPPGEMKTVRQRLAGLDEE